jgi:adenosylmethionine-8-amino-7-oxononanoate aminotransferase
MDMSGHFITPDHKEAIPLAVKGEGVYVTDREDNTYLDGCSGPMTVNLGHGNQEITEAVTRQLEAISFTYRSQFATRALEELCEKIISIAPPGLGKVSLCNSGSEASELALKMAYSYFRGKGKSGKNKMISRWHSYHGATLGALSLSGNPGRRWDYSPFLSGYPSLELPYCFRCPYEKTYPQCELFCARYLERVIVREGPETVAAFFAEPITGASGAGIHPPKEYFPLIQEICKKYDVLLVMDEVITGFGRIGRNFASDYYQVQPDILIFGKGVSSGFGPLAGILVREDRYQEMLDGGVEFGTGHTYGGNPLSAAAGCAVIDYLENNHLVEQVNQKGEMLENLLRGLLERAPMVVDVRGVGLLWGVELATSKEDNIPFPPKNRVTQKVVAACKRNGLLVYPSSGFVDGVQGDSVLISPPFIISEKELQELVYLLEKSLVEVAREF